MIIRLVTMKCMLVLCNKGIVCRPGTMAPSKGINVDESKALSQCLKSSLSSNAHITRILGLGKAIDLPARWHDN